VQTFRKRRAGLSATAGLSCITLKAYLADMTDWKINVSIAVIYYTHIKDEQSRKAHAYSFAARCT